MTMTLLQVNYTHMYKPMSYSNHPGHGIITASGETYILPYDGRPAIDLLDRTALLQKELFAEIEKANPRNVTIFLDACYTGKAQTAEVLIADADHRPIAILPIDDGMPDSFTLITASSDDEFSGPLEEAKCGLFSYLLMKGIEGDAGSNQDKKITTGELHQLGKKISHANQLTSKRQNCKVTLTEFW